MNEHTIEAWREGDSTTWLTFAGRLSDVAKQTGKVFWTFKRAGHYFTVVGMNYRVSEELASVAVDNFLRPRTDIEVVNFSRFDVLPVGSGRRK